MADKLVHQCQCPECRQLDEHPNKVLHHRLNVFLSCLNEHQGRCYVALGSVKSIYLSYYFDVASGASVVLLSTVIFGIVLLSTNFKQRRKRKISDSHLL
ncbi:MULTISPECIES: hypothetical protein [Cyanophyceae]|uniref:hypothetical protein n=1 Tax=Cyanophyceae TaxID=3028117 RepID=UPI000900675E|nr:MULTISPECIES: hypothetical protein [Cyanophyceae]PPS42002.1 hypothetical protein B1A85_16170 [Chroococcidiopsis sp. TS-821]